MLKPKEYLEELARWDIKAEYEWGRIKLRGGREDAREYYSAMLKESAKFEGVLIWYLAQTNANIMDSIEERRAIRWVENGDDSIEGAIMCSMPY